MKPLAGLVLVLGVLGTPAYGQAVYERILVEPDGGGNLAATACDDVNDVGLVVGGTQVAGVPTHFEWTADGGFSFPTHLSPGGIRRVNNHGDSVLWATGGSDDLILADGTHVLIPNPLNDGNFASKRDLNDALWVVAQGAATGTTSSVFSWDPVRGTVTVPVHAATSLRRVNSGTLAVGGRVIAGADRGFLVDLATGEFIDFTDLLPPSGGSEALDVNDRGEVVGYGPDGVSLSAWVWSAAAGFTFLPGLKGGLTQYVYPEAIDNSGRVVGSALTAAEEFHAFLWDPQTGMVDLNDVVGVQDDFLIVAAKDLSESGVILGRGFHGPGWGPDRGVILKPKPGPQKKQPGKSGR